MIQDKNIKKNLFWLISLSALIRIIIASVLELGNDEVYYWTYALYPDLSHFDHPPMVGLVIQLFTINLHLKSELFIRLAAIFFCSINTYIIFLIGKNIKDELTGFYASLLYTSSIYCFIISGTFILPDSPQLFFWLISLYLTIKIISKTEQRSTNNNFFLLGISIGFALLSKYQSLFLWIGFILYILLYNRKLLSKGQLYLSMLISIILFIPVIIWNINNHFITLSYHSSRVGFFSSGIHINYFLTELSGEIFYNNPVNFILIIIALVALIKGKGFISKEYFRLLLCLSIPLISIVLFFSLFDSTLPHWTGPAYISLIIITASRLSSKQYKSIIPLPVKVSLSLLLVIIILGVAQINYGLPINLGNNSEEHQTDSSIYSEQGENDPTLDMYGWRQLKDKFSDIMREHNDISSDVPIVSTKWFPAANLDYYVAQPLNKKLFVIGDMSAIHKYYWINRSRGGLQKGSDAWYINLSTCYTDPDEYFGKYYQVIIPTDTIKIYRNNKVVKFAFIYQLKNYSY